MRRRFLPLAAAFSMMAAAADEQQPGAARESLPAPNGERYDGPDDPQLAASEPPAASRAPDSAPAA